VNLDVPPDFTAAVPVVAGGTGPFSGDLPASLVRPDRNNIAPRIGAAWRVQPRTVIRGGYGVNYNAGGYAGIAQQLAGQPPFATTDTRIGGASSPLDFTRVFTTPTAAVTTNTFGIDPDYRLGYVQIWNLDVQRELTRTILLSGGYTGTRGGDLDLLRAPNRGPTGLRIDGVQPFIWDSSGGTSTMNAVTVRLRKRQTRGYSMGGAYTLSKSIDNASSIGGGGSTVAQNDQDLEAERGPSSFDQRHRFNADFTCELPFGPQRRWLTGDGALSHVLRGWMWSGDVQLASGLPFTARVLGDTRDVGRGTNGSLRADYTGAPIAIDHPSTLQFFNTAAFAIPAPGTFGNAGRNSIRGPGQANVNMALTKNITLKDGRALSLRVQANNVLNRPQFSAVDGVVNSPTFGRVIAVRPMRTVQIVARVRF
jgi:trimeric autotransporter adhesin